MYLVFQAFSDKRPPGKSYRPTLADSFDDVTIGEIAEMAVLPPYRDRIITITAVFNPQDGDALKNTEAAAASHSAKDAITCVRFGNSDTEGMLTIHDLPEGEAMKVLRDLFA